MPFKALGNIVVNAAPPDPARLYGQDGSKAVSRGTCACLSSFTVPAILLKLKHDGCLEYCLSLKLKKKKSSTTKRNVTKSQ